MSPVSNELLRSLGGIPRVGVAAASSAADDKASRGVVEFEKLLQQAKNGEARSGLPVRLGSGVEVKLSADQLARLSEAADRAEARGAARALVLIDGMALTLDVGGRTITGTLDPNDPGATTEVDAVVVAPSTKPKETSLKPPSRGTIANPSLARAFDSTTETN